jgi:hypothetical protein
MRQNRAFFAWRSATRSILARPGRATQVLPSFVARRRSWGSRPFAGLLPPAGGRAALLRGGRANPAVQRLGLLIPATRSRSAFLPVRAHVPFVPPHPPRLIFVGVTERLLENSSDLQKRSAGGLMASTSGLRSRLRSARPAPCGRSCDPALGFASRRVVGHVSPCIGPGSTPVSDHPSPDPPPAALAGDETYPLMGLRRGCSRERSAGCPPTGP